MNAYKVTELHYKYGTEVMSVIVKAQNHLDAFSEALELMNVFSQNGVVIINLGKLRNEKREQS